MGRVGTNARTAYELIGLAIILIYIICAVIFESLWQLLAVIGPIPLFYTVVVVFLPLFLRLNKLASRYKPSTN